MRMRPLEDFDFVGFSAWFGDALAERRKHQNNLILIFFQVFAFILENSHVLMLLMAAVLARRRLFIVIHDLSLDVLLFVDEHWHNALEPIAFANKCLRNFGERTLNLAKVVLPLGRATEQRTSVQRARNANVAVVNNKRSERHLLDMNPL